MSAQNPQTYAELDVGDPAPWFKQRCTSNPTYVFNSVAGRYVVLCLFVSAADPASVSALETVERNRAIFDDERIAFFGVSMNPDDESSQRVRQSLPGIRHFWDDGAKICKAYGTAPVDYRVGSAAPMRRSWIVLDPTLRVIAKFPFGDGTAAAHQAVFDFLKALPPADRYAGFEVFAPILVLPNVFEPKMCEFLIERYQENGGKETGFMREVDGKTVEIRDVNHKVRKDFTVTDPRVIASIQNRIQRRVSPEIKKVYSFDVTRIERYLVGCYAAEDKAHFRAHRDNTTSGTAHRRFAVSINLNHEFEGGEVKFPEYGGRTYKAPAGGAVVFPCSLLHAVTEVTKGERYAFLPFLYDEAAAAIRQQNRASLRANAPEEETLAATRTSASG